MISANDELLFRLIDCETIEMREISFTVNNLIYSIFYYLTNKQKNNNNNHP